MSTSQTPSITVVEGPTTITVEVPRNQQEAVLAAISSVINPPLIEAELEPSAATRNIVPSGGPSPAMMTQKHKQARLPIHVVLTEEEHVPVDLTLIAPPKQGRSQFNLPTFIKGDPKRLRQLSVQVLSKMPWLIDMLPDDGDFPKLDGTTKAQEVRKCLEKNSDKITGNPNHWALVELLKLQKELFEQEANKEQLLRLQTVRTAPKPLEHIPKPPSNNGWGKVRSLLSPEEQALADAQSAAALASKQVTIGQPNRQGAVASRGTSVPGVGGGGSKKKRAGQKAKRL